MARRSRPPVQIPLLGSPLVLHRPDQGACQHRPPRRRKCSGGRRDHGRVPLPLRPLARRRLANPAPHPAPRPLPPDVRHSRRLVVFLQTTCRAHRRTHHPASGKSRRTQRTRPLLRLSGPLHPERMRRHRPRPALHELLHHGGKNTPSPAKLHSQGSYTRESSCSRWALSLSARGSRLGRDLSCRA